METVKFALVDALIEDQQAIGVLLAQRGSRNAVIAPSRSDRNEQIVTSVHGALGDASEQGREEIVTNIREQQPQGLGFASSQVSGCCLRNIAQLLDRR